MCGIVAAFSKNNNFTQTLLNEMLNKIEHRGFDDIGFYINNGVGIAHNRLSITGNKGKQPLISHEQDVVAVVNGEFYGYEKIRAKFKKQGYQFLTETDSEVVIPLYQKLGLSNEFFNELNGEFSSIIYDKRNNKVIAFRDRFGIKPLYYYTDNNNIYFASEQKAFLAINNMQWSDNALNSILTMQYHSSKSTLLKNVKQVQGGTYLVIDLNTMKIEETKYWDMNYQPDNSMTFQDSKELLREALTSSIKDRISVERKKAITLSGGIDSSVIFGLASQITNEKLDAFTLSFQNGGNYDECAVAKEMCNMYQGNFNPVMVTESDMLNNIENATYHSEEVSINSHLPAKYLLFKAMKEAGVKVSLSGEGADELLLGYPHFKLDLDNSNDNIASNEYLSGLQTPDKESLSTAIIQKELGFVPKFLEAKYSMGLKLQNEVLRADYVQSMFDPIKDILKPLNMPKMDNVYVSSYLWSKICLGNYILVGLGDKMEMAHTIEGRVPFLDKRVYDVAQKLPTDFNMNKDSVEKYILKETFKNDITPMIYQKQKHPFIAPPLLSWSGGSQTNNVITMLFDILNSKSMQNHKFFDSVKIKKMIEGLIKSDNPALQAKYDPIIMLILTLYYFEKNFIS
jgi:asparagine synthase (glutamine-hydrolysing)